MFRKIPKFVCNIEPLFQRYSGRFFILNVLYFFQNLVSEPRNLILKLLISNEEGLLLGGRPEVVALKGLAEGEDIVHIDLKYVVDGVLLPDLDEFPAQLADTLDAGLLVDARHFVQDDVD